MEGEIWQSEHHIITKKFGKYCDIIVKTCVAGSFVVMFTENQVKMMGRDAKQSPNFKLVIKTAKF